MSDTLVSRNSNFESIKPQPMSSGLGVEPKGCRTGGVWALLLLEARAGIHAGSEEATNWNQRLQSTHLSSTSNVLSAYENTKFSRYQESSKFSSPPIATLVESVSPTHALCPLPSNKSLTYGAIDSMTCNSSLLLHFVHTPLLLPLS